MLFALVWIFVFLISGAITCAALHFLGFHAVIFAMLVFLVVKSFD
jgi:hypothetical protein